VIKRHAVAAVFCACTLLVTDANAEVVAEDDFGRQVKLAEPAGRILSLAPHNTENLFSAGAGEKIVGVVEYSDYPAAAEKILSVGTHVQFNLEAIVSLKPDLVVAWQGGNNREALTQVERLGIAVYYSEPRTFADIIENIKELARLAGTESDIDPLVHSISQNIEKSRATFSSRPEVGIFYQVWTAPLMTLNGDHFLTRVLEVCGAVNLFADLPIIAPRVNIEAVIKANPDAIITGMVDGMKPDMSIWQDWKSVNAVNNEHFIFVDSDVMHRHTLRMLHGIESLCQQIDHVRNDMEH